jgi:hypothetical protein
VAFLYLRIKMSDWGQRAFDTVTEITKQVLTLATAIITLSITFAKDFATHASAGAKDTLAWGWGFYAISILFGLLTLMASAGNQQRGADQGTAPTINSGNLRWMGGIQLIAFFVAIVLTVAAGIVAI